MKRPSKKEIKAAVDKLKLPTDATSSASDEAAPKPNEKKGNQRIRKRTI